jgi:hypothetical protein
MPHNRPGVPCEICGTPTASYYKVCKRTEECAREQQRRRKGNQALALRPCEICDGLMSSSTGVCKQTKECRAERERRRKHKVDVFCRSCGQRSDTRNITGFCYRTDACRRAARLGVKRLTLDAYGGVCACCGEDFLLFLTLDHVNGDGAAHRKDSPWAVGTNLYRELHKLGFPDKERYQVLCHNCNMGKRQSDTCPCKRREEVPDWWKPGGSRSFS